MGIKKGDVRIVIDDLYPFYDIDSIDNQCHSLCIISGGLIKIRRVLDVVVTAYSLPNGRVMVFGKSDLLKKTVDYCDE